MWVWGLGGQGTLVPSLPLPLIPKLAQSPRLSAPSPLAEKWGTRLGKCPREKDRALSSEMRFFLL